MNNTFQLRVAWNGTITLLKKLREENNIKRDDTVTLIELGNTVIVIRRESSPIEQIASKLAKERQDQGKFRESIT